MTQHSNRLGIGAHLNLFDEKEKVVEAVLVTIYAPFAPTTLGLVGSSLVEVCD